jgi:hypothetical protein
MPTRFILSRIRAQEMADDGSNLDCIFFGCRTQSCGRPIAGVTFGMRRMIEMR